MSDTNNNVLLNPMAKLSSDNGNICNKVLENLLLEYSISHKKEQVLLDSAIGGKHRHDFVIQIENENYVLESKSQLSSGGDMWQKIFYNIHSFSCSPDTKCVIVFFVGPNTKDSVVYRVLPAIQKAALKTKNVRVLTIGEFTDAIDQQRVPALFA